MSREGRASLIATGVLTVVSLIDRVLSMGETDIKTELVLYLATSYLRAVVGSTEWEEVKGFVDGNADLSDGVIEVFSRLDESSKHYRDLPNRSAGYVEEPSPEFDEGLENELWNILSGGESGE